MRFVYFADRIHPADREAAGYVANLEEGDELELVQAKRTTQQNNALWLYCAKLAKALNDAGFDLKTYPWREGLSIPFSRVSVMEHFWRPVQMAVTGKKSTTRLDTKEVNAIYLALDKAMSERVGVRVEFPSQESLAGDAND